MVSAAWTVTERRSTDLARTGSSRGSRARSGHGRSGRAVRSIRQSMRMSSILLRPMLVAWRRVTLVLRHIVTLLGVGRVRRIRRTRSGYGRIYRYLGVRLYMWCVMMVILVSILQGQGRTCCLSHTDCTGVPLLLCVCWSRNVFSKFRGARRAEDGLPQTSDVDVAAAENFAGNFVGRTSRRVDGAAADGSNEDADDREPVAHNNGERSCQPDCVVWSLSTLLAINRCC